MKRTNIKPLVLSTLISLFTLGVSVSSLQAASLDLGKGEGSPGGTVTLPITLSGGSGIVAAGIDISYDSSRLKNPRAKAGPAAQSAEKEIYSSTPSRRVLRVGIVGINLHEIPDGVVAAVSFDVMPRVLLRKKIVLGNSPSASDAAGNLVKVSGSKGLITIK